MFEAKKYFIGLGNLQMWIEEQLSKNILTQISIFEHDVHSKYFFYSEYNLYDARLCADSAVVIYNMLYPLFVFFLNYISVHMSLR